MEKFPTIVWAGRFDPQQVELHQLIGVFATRSLPQNLREYGPVVRSLSFNERTVETLCNAVINAEDAIRCTDAAGNESRHPTSILTDAEKDQIFSTMHSPYFGPLVALVNILLDSEFCAGVDADAYIFRPLKKYWSRMIRHLWDHPARSLTAPDVFREERSLVPIIFDRIIRSDHSFGSVIKDDSDLTIPLITRYWIHATGEEEMRQFLIFFLMLIPRRGVPGSSNSEPLNFVAEGESDTTVTVLRRILQDNDTIAEFIQATTSHLRRFRDFEATTVTGILVIIWNWARAFQQDPLFAEFLRVIRTSAPLWSTMFEVLSRPNGQQSAAPFSSTHHSYISTLAVQLVHDRSSSSEAMALTELWVSTGVFDALEASIGEVLLHGTEDEQIKFCTHLASIYHGISYGPMENPSFISAMRQQLPRPQTIGRLWKVSQKLSGAGVKEVAPSHAARMVVVTLETVFTLPDACKRRGCDKKSTAQCTKCKSGYCGVDCQKRDWKDHKMVCGITMDMDPAVRDESYSLIAGPNDWARLWTEMGLN